MPALSVALKSQPSLTGWVVLSVGALLIASPIGALLWSWTENQTEVWLHLWQTQLPRLILNTFSLLVCVSLGVLLVGVTAAWFVVAYEFPGRRCLEWALVLPMAIPSYVMAFVFLGTWDFNGILQQSMKLWWPEFHYVSLRGLLGVSTVLTLVFYPYVYLSSRMAFARLSTNQIEVARLMGRSGCQAFLQVALPMAKPGVLVGLALVLMETLADFGAVAIFNFDTFTTAIYKTWYGFFNLVAAAQLASLLLVMVLMAVWLEIHARKLPVSGANTPKRVRRPLVGLKAFIVSSALWLLLTVALIIPLIQLCIWAWQYLGDIDERFLNSVLNSFYLGLWAAALLLVTGFVLAWYRHIKPQKRVALIGRIMTSGYALPGALLAVGIMLVLVVVDRWLLAPVLSFWGLASFSLTGSLVGLLLAYWIRFFSVAHQPLHAAFHSLTPALSQAARTLGIKEKALPWRLYLPMLSPTCLAVALMVAIEVMKELPATLLLRPFGWDTLAVKVYELTSEGEWERAALPSIFLVMLSLMLAAYVTARGELKTG